MAMTVLLTLGRLPKGLELARCLHEAGHRVLVADPFSLHLCKPSRAVSRSFKVPAPATDQSGFLSALADIVRREGVDLVIPVSEEVLHAARLSAHLTCDAIVLCPPFEALLELHDKQAFPQRVAAAGLRAPETVLGDDPTASALMQTGPTVAKGRFGCSGAKLAFHAQGATLPGAQANADWVVQRRVEGREVCTQAFCRDGQLLGHVTYRGLIHSGTVAVCFEQIDAPEIEAWTRQFVAHIGYTGFIAFDFIVDEAGTPFVLECNPRLTSGIHFFDHASLATAVCDPTSNQPIELKPQKRFQEGHTALTQAYSQILRPRTYWATLKTMGSARDVLWSSRDPLVFPLMTPMSWPVLKQVLFEGRNFGEAATLDIEWTGSGAQARPGEPAQLEARAS